MSELLKRKKKIRCCSASAVVNTNFISPQVIRERAENISSTESESDSDSGTKKRQAFLDMLLKTVDEEGKGMSHQDIQEEVDTFMFRVGAKKLTGWTKSCSYSLIFYIGDDFIGSF